MAAAALKKKGLITYTRGLITIPDVKLLEKKACECYHVIKDHLDNYTEFDSGIISLRSALPEELRLLLFQVCVADLIGLGPHGNEESRRIKGARAVVECNQ
jgi:hypothetical protein